MIKAVIFDLDGVMIDSEDLHSKAFEILLKKNGAKPKYNKDGIVQTLGIGAKKNLQKMKKQYKLKKDLNTLVITRNKIYAKLLREDLQPTEGLSSLLDLLTKNSFKLAIASGSVKKDVLFVVNKLKIKDKFKAIVSLEDTKKGKPAPDVYLKAAKRLKVEPDRCMVIEDAQAGIVSAKKAGMKIIAVNTSHNSSQNLSKADIIVDSLSDINLKTIQGL